MPRTKKIVIEPEIVKPVADEPEKAKDGLWEFEQFVAKTPLAPVKKRPWLVIVFIVIIVILLLALLYFMKFGQTVAQNQFKALYLENGQVYYAKVVKEDKYSIYLDEVYYIQNEERTVPAEEGATNEEPQTVTVPVLVKRGQELSKPQGWLVLNRQKVVAIETLGSDSPVIEEIKKLNQ